MLQQNVLLFIGAVMYEILDEARYYLIFLADIGLIPDINIELGQT